MFLAANPTVASVFPIGYRVIYQVFSCSRFLEGQDLWILKRMSVGQILVVCQKVLKIIGTCKSKSVFAGLWARGDSVPQTIPSTGTDAEFTQVCAGPTFTLVLHLVLK